MLNVNSMTDQHEFMGKYFDSWLLDGTETRGKRRIDEPLGSETGFLVREKFKQFHMEIHQGKKLSVL